MHCSRRFLHGVSAAAILLIGPPEGLAQQEEGRMAYGFIQKTLGLTGGNLTTHLRRLEDAGFLVTSKEFVESRPRTWVQATEAGRRAFADYLANLEKALKWPAS